MRVHWQTFEQDGQLVEAQVFRSDTPSEKLVLFCPGFPGLGATMFEQRHAGELVRNGFDVAVIKHAGTRLDNPLTPATVNNSQRLADARAKGETHLGGGPSTMANWLREPLIVLQNLHVNYGDIRVIGNSFGAISALWSLTRREAPLQHVTKLVCYAGAQGLDNGPSGAMSIWQPIYVDNPLFWTFITLDGAQAVHDTMKMAYADIADDAADLPQHIDIQYLVVKADEILPLKFTEDYKAHIGGRGTIVIDDIDVAYPAYNMRAHDTPDYPTEKLLELLK